MKRTAVIYTRVSTDAQAEKGYSLRDQEDKIRTYCNSNNIEVLKHFQEDYSAKDFNRPEWKLLIEYLRKNKREIDEFIFLKWDRFSRNVMEALLVSQSIKELGIKVTCIENDIDDSIPENILYKLIMLGIPEVENRRRSLNVKSGMRRAMKEGRWPQHAPIGYKNSRDENNNKTIIIDDEIAPLIKEAFVEMAKGQRTQQDIRLALQKKGLKCSKSLFSIMLHSKFYIGKIVIPAYKDEPYEIVEGLHDAIVDERIFNSVQEVLSDRKKKRNIPSTKQQKPELPLRGYILCHKCEQKMTGSASKGNGGRYFYYHCNKCGTRVRSEVANDDFEKLLKKIELTDSIKELMKLEVVEQVKRLQSYGQQTERGIKKELIKQEQRKQRLDNNYLDGDLSTKNYNYLRSNVDDKIMQLQHKLMDLTKQKNDLSSDLLKGIDTMSIIHKLYINSDIENKRKVIGSIFPRKFIFQDGKVRTESINEVVPWVTKNSKDFTKKETGRHRKYSKSSCLVVRTGFEPVLPG